MIERIRSLGTGPESATPVGKAPLRGRQPAKFTALTRLAVLFAAAAGLALAPLPAAGRNNPTDLAELLAGAQRAPAPTGLDWLREPEQRFSPLSSLERQFLERQRERIDRLARRRLGRPLRTGPPDLEILQQLLDRRVVAADDRETLQAMGVVLGDVLVARFGYQWTGYDDARGRARALRDPGSDRVYFPITAISRRVEAGLRTDVSALVDRLAPEYARQRDVAVTLVPEEPWWERLR